MRPPISSPTSGSDFALSSASRDFPLLKLASVERHAQPNSLRAEPFRLLFVGDLVLDQRIHELRHPDLGALEIFLVPIGPDLSGKLQYEAVFK